MYFQNKITASVTAKIQGTDKTVSFSGIAAEDESGAEVISEGVDELMQLVGQRIVKSSVVRTIKQEVVEDD